MPRVGVWVNSRAALRALSAEQVAWCVFPAPANAGYDPGSGRTFRTRPRTSPGPPTDRHSSQAVECGHESWPDVSGSTGSGSSVRSSPASQRSSGLLRGAGPSGAVMSSDPETVCSRQLVRRLAPGGHCEDDYCARSPAPYTDSKSQSSSSSPTSGWSTVFLSVPPWCATLKRPHRRANSGLDLRSAAICRYLPVGWVAESYVAQVGDERILVLLRERMWTSDG